MSARPERRGWGFAGVRYHLMARGDWPEAICEDDVDRRDFSRVPDAAVHCFNWCLHAHGVERNHDPLLAEAKRTT